MLWGSSLLPQVFHLVMTEFLMGMQISGSNAPAMGRTSGAQRTQAASAAAPATPATGSAKAPAASAQTTAASSTAAAIPSASASGLGALINVAA